MMGLYMIDWNYRDRDNYHASRVEEDRGVWFIRATCQEEVDALNADRGASVHKSYEYYDIIEVEVVDADNLPNNITYATKEHYNNDEHV